MSIISPKPIPSHSNQKVLKNFSHTHMEAYKEMLGRKEMKDSPISHTHSQTATIFFSDKQALPSKFLPSVRRGLFCTGLRSNMQCMY